MPIPSFIPASNDGQSTGTTELGIVGSPPNSNTVRLVKNITINNIDDIAHEVYIFFKNDTDRRRLRKTLLLPDGALVLGDADFVVLDTVDKSITMELGEAISTDNLDFVTSWTDSVVT